MNKLLCATALTALLGCSSQKHVEEPVPKPEPILPCETVDLQTGIYQTNIVDGSSMYLVDRTGEFSIDICLLMTKIENLQLGFITDLECNDTADFLNLDGSDKLYSREEMGEHVHYYDQALKAGHEFVCLKNRLGDFE